MKTLLLSLSPVSKVGIVLVAMFPISIVFAFISQTMSIDEKMSLVLVSLIPCLLGALFLQKGLK